MLIWFLLMICKNKSGPCYNVDYYTLVYLTNLWVLDKQTFHKKLGNQSKRKARNKIILFKQSFFSKTKVCKWAQTTYAR